MCPCVVLALRPRTPPLPPPHPPPPHHHHHPQRREEDRKREQQEGARLQRIRQRITGEGQRGGAASEVASAAVNESDEEEI